MISPPIKTAFPAPTKITKAMRIVKIWSACRWRNSKLPCTKSWVSMHLQATDVSAWRQEVTSPPWLSWRISMGGRNGMFTYTWMAKVYGTCSIYIYQVPWILWGPDQTTSPWWYMFFFSPLMPRYFFRETWRSQSHEDPKVDMKFFIWLIICYGWLDYEQVVSGKTGVASVTATIR